MTRRASSLNNVDSGISREIGAQYANVKIVAEHIETIIELSELNLPAALDGKVDKVAGKELSDNNYTDDEKTKLAGLEGIHFKGEFVSLSALQAAWAVASAGDYANVDTGVGSDVLRFIWDANDQKWVEQIGVSTQLTGAQIKVMYEDQPDTNAFTDTEKAKLAAYPSTPLSGSASVLIDVATQQIRTQAVTGEVTIPQNGTVATITNKAVNNSKLADMTGNTVKGKVGVTGTPTDLTAAELRTMLDVAEGATAGANWNTNLSNIPAALVGITATGVSLLQTLSLVTVSFPRMNADRTVTYLSAADLITAIGAVSLDTAQTITGSKTFSVAVSVASLGSSGTIGAAGAITSGTSLGAPAVSGGTANFGTYSGGPAVLTGTSQIDFLGLGTSSLGSDRLRVNGTSTFFGHAVVNGNVTATTLIGAAALSGGTADGVTIGGTTRATANVTSLDANSDITMSGSAKRFIADFSNATLSSRMSFQTSTVNGVTTVQVMPNGTGSASSLLVSNNSNLAAASVAYLTVDTTSAKLVSTQSGGSLLPLDFVVGGSTRQSISTAGAVLFNAGSVTLNAPSGQSSLFLQQAGTTNGKVYASGGGGTDVAIDSGRVITLNPTTSFSVNYSGISKFSVDSTGNTSVSGSMTAPNFYGNGFNLTQLDASKMPNGTLNSNIFPSTITAATITFDGAITIKGGGTYSRLVLNNSDTTLRNTNGNSVFNASATDTSIQRDGNITLAASSTQTQLFSRTGNIAATFDASTSQLHGPSGAPFLQASTTVSKLNATTGATSIEIDSSGSAMIKFTEFLVSTKPSASANPQRVIIISNATLGYGLYISDGTNWRSAQSGTVQA